MRNGVANGQNGCSGLPNQNIILQLANGSEWVTATDLPTVFETVRRFTAANKKWRVVAGNTGTGKTNAIQFAL
jgi:excinuclease UvrABC helicase subunit UvrB